MLPIVGYPSVVNFGLSAFREVFSKPQLRHFGEYVTGLMVCQNRTVQGINDSLFARCDQSALNHFLTDSPWSEEELDRKRHELVRDRLGELRLGRGTLIIDDTISHHVGKHMEGAGWHHDASEGKSVWGHQLVTSHYVKQWLSLPLDFRIYIKEEQAGESFKTKLEFARELVELAVKHGIPFSCVVFDTWYFSLDFVDFLEGLGKDWVTRCKSNRVVISGRRRPISEWARGLPKRDFERVVLERRDGTKEVYYACSRTVRFEGFGKRVRVVVSYSEEKFEKKEDPYLYCTNRLDWEVRKIMRTYAKRSEVDAFYKDAKQNLGMEEYELRKIGGIRRHLQMILTAHTLLSLGSADRAAGKAMVYLETIGAACRRAFAEILRSFIQAVLEIGKRVKDPARILRVLSSSRKQLGRMRGSVKTLIGGLKA
ncbi:MAG: IS701 family transposase [Candidatus Hadarchaeota archaeon]|nr:IS701 family transposase [Candidatus Hadarchaeota archaeon]